MENMKLLLANAGIKPDTTLIDEAKQKQEEHDRHIALIETVIEAQQAVADKHNPLLKATREKMQACCDKGDKVGEAKHFAKVKEIIETMATEAQAEEDRIKQENGIE